MTGENSGRVTTQQFYEALMDCTKEMGKMELRIVKEISKGIATQQEHQQSVEARLAEGSVHFKKFEKDIDSLKLWDRGLGAISIIGSTIASIIGIEK